MRRVALLCAVLAVPVLLCSCGSGGGQTAAPPAAPPASAVPSGTVGGPVQVATGAGAAAVTLVKTARDGAGRARFTVRIVNTGAAVLGYGPGNFELSGPGGRRYDRDGSAGGLLEAGSALNPGRAVTGDVVFTAAPAHGVLMFTPDGAAAAAAEWPY